MEANLVKTLSETNLDLQSIDEKYDVVERAGYRKLIGEWLYLGGSTRLDISFAVS